jgi:cation diffusion facilitator family transporter
MAQGKVAVYAALAGNAAVMVSKFIAAMVSGSASLLAESLHSFADTSDSALLLLGEHRSKKPPDDLHPFGHGRELYFWSMVVALMIFMLGGLASIIEGIARIKKPEELGDPKWNYIVLGVAFLFEATTGVIAFRQFRKDMKPGEGWWDAFQTAKDPTVFMVLFEDSAALVGILLAFLGVFLSHVLKAPWIDGAASVAIGLVLAAVGIVLCREVQKLLIGERVDHALIDGLRDLLQKDPAVETVPAIHTMHQGPEDVLAILIVRFKDTPDPHASAGRIRRAVQQRWKELKWVYIALDNDPAAGSQPQEKEPQPEAA